MGERATEAEKRGTERVMGTKDESGRQCLQTLTRKLCHKKKDDLYYNRKVDTANFNTENPKKSLTVQNTHSCLFLFIPKQMSPSRQNLQQTIQHESWVNYSKSVKKIGNPGVRQRTHCNCPASNFLSGLLLYSSPIYYQSGPPNLPP